MSTVHALKKRPTLILVLSAARFGAAWLASLPVIAVLRGIGVGELLEGDRALFAPGGLMLMEVLTKHGRELWAASGATLLSFCVSWVLLLVPFTLLLVGLARPGKLTLTDHGLDVLQALPKIAVLGVLSVVVQTLAVLLGVLGLASVLGLAESSSPPTRLAIFAGGAATTLSLWLVLAGLRDLACAAVVAERVRVVAALQMATGALRHRLRLVLVGYASYLLASVVVLIASALGADVIDVARPGAHRVILAVVVHQLALFALAALRAGWLDTSLVAVSSSSPELDDTRARSDAPGDPNPDPGASFGAPNPGSAPN